MFINFGRPEYLMIIPICILILLFIGYKTKMLHSKRSKILLMVRILVIVLIGFSLGEIRLQLPIDETTTIFVVDQSSSIDNQEGVMVNFINEALVQKDSYDYVGLVGFGEKAVIENIVSQELEKVAFEASLNRGFTNIEEGLRVAGTMFPEQSLKRIILLSDGMENIGDGLAQGRQLQDQGVQIDVLKVRQKIQEDVQVTDLSIPKYLNKMQRFDIGVTIDSLMDTEGSLKIYNGNRLISNQPIQIQKGENRFVLSDQATEGGNVIYRAEVEAAGDTIPENNSAYGYGYVEDIPRVLLISNKTYGEEVKRILNNGDIHLIHKTPETIPTSLETLALYDTIILANVSADELEEDFMNHLEQYVKHLGGGLVVTGGENAYALGGYKGTPLETVLPVKMDIKEPSKIPDLGLVIVTDRSGSMGSAPYGISKLELAKEAAIRSMEALNPFDSIGIIAFDDQPQWIVDFQSVEESKEDMIKDISGITVGGGTSIIPGLQAAVETLESANTKLKHVIVLTDGQAEQQGYDKIIAALQREGITLSTVAVGADADTSLLQFLGEQGKGRYYYTDEFSDLPKIFMKETMLASKSYVNTRTFYPKITGISDILKGIRSTGSLDGYITTTTKERAQVIITSDEDDPILAIWQYGLGKAAAWTSDMHNQWTANWLSTEEGVEVFRNTVAWTLKNKTTDQMIIDAEIKGSEVEVTAQIKEFYDIDHIIATVINESGKVEEISFQAIEPGVFKGDFQGKPTGAYTLHVQGMKEEQLYEEVVSIINIPFSPEYDIRMIQQRQSVLERLASQTGGRIIDDPVQIFQPMEKEMLGSRDLDNFLLSMALILFILDIALRRFPDLSRSMSTSMAGLIERGKVPQSTFIKRNILRKKKRKKDTSDSEQKDISSILVRQKKKRNNLNSRQKK